MIFILHKCSLRKESNDDLNHTDIISPNIQMTYSVALFCYPLLIIKTGGHMEAIMIVGVAVVAVSGWYSALDLLADMGIRFRKRSMADGKIGRFPNSYHVSSQQRVKQMAGVNI